MKQFGRRATPALVAVALLVLITAVLLIAKNRSRKLEATKEEMQISEGVMLLEALEARNPREVEEQLRVLREERIRSQQTEYIERITSGEVSVWSLFEDYVLLGDSRAVGFYYYEFLPEDLVLAEGGATIRALKDHIPDIEAIHPAFIFLCYGLNDVSIGLWNNPEEYTAEFEQTLEEIHKALPEAKIFISSILPARDPAFETASVWREIPEWSAAIEDMCEAMDYCWYVDNSEISEIYADMWDIDGIHVWKTFYPYWAANMMAEVYGSVLSEVAEEENLPPA